MTPEKEENINQDIVEKENVAIELLIKNRVNINEVLDILKKNIKKTLTIAYLIKNV